MAFGRPLRVSRRFERMLELLAVQFLKLAKEAASAPDKTRLQRVRGLKQYPVKPGVREGRRMTARNRAYYEKLAALASPDVDRPEVALAQGFVAKN